jgi:hypothetical protein
MLPIFIHIPKAAGTTLRLMAEEQYGKDSIITVYGQDIWNCEQFLKGVSMARWQKCSMVRGHIQFGCHEWIPRNCRYFTIVRHPVDRVWSLYKYMKADRMHGYHKQAMSMTLPQLLESGISTEFDNGQVRQLCGTAGEFPQEPSTPPKIPYGGMVQDDAEKAVDNLQEWFDVVGTVRGFEKFVDDCNRWLGWAVLFYKRANVSRGQKASELSQTVRDAILEYNQLDLQLYEYAVKWNELRGV